MLTILLLTVLFICILFIWARYEEYIDEKNNEKCRKYLTGKKRYIKTMNGIEFQVEHFHGNTKFFKKATIKERNYIKSLKYK